jgi:hypothetical protein
MADLMIKIGLDQNQVVVCAADPTHVKGGDTVTWTTDLGPFVVKFDPLDNTPFTNKTMQQWTGGAGVNSATSTVQKTPTGTFKYNVTVTVNGVDHSQDPTIIVDPS